MARNKCRSSGLLLSFWLGSRRRRPQSAITFSFPVHVSDRSADADGAPQMALWIHRRRRLFGHHLPVPATMAKTTKFAPRPLRRSLRQPSEPQEAKLGPPTRPRLFLLGARRMACRCEYANRTSGLRHFAKRRAFRKSSPGTPRTSCLRAINMLIRLSTASAGCNRSPADQLSEQSNSKI